jgi:hypothetical protein
MRNLLVIGVLLTMGLSAPVEGAEITRTINFTPLGQPLTPFGSFTYDTSTGQFTDFSITWDGLDFPLIDFANYGPFGGDSCLDGLTGAAATLVAFSNACTESATSLTWLAWINTGGQAAFYISWSYGDPYTNYMSMGFNSTATGASTSMIYVNASGNWTVAPEPSTLIIVPATLFLFAMVGEERGAQWFRQRTQMKL